ncbi:MAG TPA: AAA family ATPase [Candidatus Binatia bacterium]|jgi:hypothetical protein
MLNGCPWEDTASPTDTDAPPWASIAGRFFDSGESSQDSTHEWQFPGPSDDFRAARIGHEEGGRVCTKAGSGPYALIPLSALPDDPVKPEDVLWGDLLFRGATTVLAGQPGAGKTTFARGIAVAVATGGEFCGFRGPPNGAAVIYFDYETPGAYRIPRWKLVCGDDLSNVSNLFVNDAYAPFDPQVVAAEAQRLGVALIVVDTLARATCVEDENKSSEMSRVMEDFDIVAREAHCALLVVTHQSKNNHTGYRGSSAIGASASVVVTFGRANTDQGADPDSAVYVLTIEKNRLGGDGPVRLMRDGDGGFKLAPDADGFAEVSRAERAILDVLDAAGERVARKDLVAAVSRRLSESGKAPSERTIERALDKQFGLGRVLRPATGFYRTPSAKVSP